MGTGSMALKNLPSLSQGIWQPTVPPRGHISNSCEKASPTSPVGKPGFLITRLIRCSVFSVFCCHTCCQFHLIFVADLVLPFPAAKVDIPGSGSFLASLSSCGDSRPFERMSAMMAAPLKRNRTHKNRESEHYSSADVNRKLYSSLTF